MRKFLIVGGQFAEKKIQYGGLQVYVLTIASYLIILEE
jgi:hypothetical protein